MQLLGNDFHPQQGGCALPDLGMGSRAGRRYSTIVEIQRSPRSSAHQAAFVEGNADSSTVFSMLEFAGMDGWYQTFMQVSTIAFVVIDARERTKRAEELRAAGVIDLEAHLIDHPEDLAKLKFATVLDMNDAAVRIYGGTSRDDFIGQPTHRFFAPLCPVLKHAAAAYLRGENHFREQACSVRRDGSTFDTLFTAVMNAPAMPHGIWLAALIDITQQLHERSALDTLREEMAHFSRISTLGEMSASIAHELGQPLSTIEISAVAWQRMLSRPEPDLEAARAIAGRVAAQAGRAREIVERIRSMSARRPTNAVVVPVSDLVRDSWRFVRHELERSGVKSLIDVPDDGARLLVDQIQIQQVLVNLFMNAVQIMRDHGTDEPRIEITGGNNGERFVLDVRDSGPGIPKERLNRIFESFYTSRSEGLGLGLSICRTIIEAHGGTITASNRTDRLGALFRIDLPLAS
jgi:C4-dicarboxylate-specific signal transduction histidine kinase